MEHSRKDIGKTPLPEERRSVTKERGARLPRQASEGAWSEVDRGRLELLVTGSGMGGVSCRTVHRTLETARCQPIKRLKIAAAASSASGPDTVTDGTKTARLSLAAALTSGGFVLVSGLVPIGYLRPPISYLTSSSHRMIFSLGRIHHTPASGASMQFLDERRRLDLR